MTRPRRLYRSPCAVPHIILRQAEAWARALTLSSPHRWISRADPDHVLLGMGLVTRAETDLRDARGRRYRVCLWDFILSVNFREGYIIAERDWWGWPAVNSEEHQARMKGARWHFRSILSWGGNGVPSRLEPQP